MGDICGGVFTDGDKSSSCESSSRLARRRRMVIRRVKLGVDVPPSEAGRERKRPKLKICAGSSSEDCHLPAENCVFEDGKRNKVVGTRRMGTKEIRCSGESSAVQVPKTRQSCSELLVRKNPDDSPKFGTASVCGRRREMEDAVAIHPSFSRRGIEKTSSSFHYFGVYDGHGCSHVSYRCRERLHELVKEELEKTEPPVEWKNIMERSFRRMDDEVVASNNNGSAATKCRCALQPPQCDAVGSTAVVSVLTSDKIIVANCGDSRAVLCRNGKPIPLSSDHKPDRPDELSRIRAAGGRVIYWDGPRVLGVLAMSRAIGDNHLKPYVICDPEVTSTSRKEDDECLILGSDGLWDVVSNETACRMVAMCLGGKNDEEAAARGREERDGGGGRADDTCTEASMVLTKLALARGSSDNVSVVVVDLRRGTWGESKK